MERKKYNEAISSCVDLCMRNVERLIEILQSGSEEDIEKLGGEREGFNLIQRYFDLAEKLSRVYIETNPNTNLGKDSTLDA